MSAEMRVPGAGGGACFREAPTVECGHIPTELAGTLTLHPIYAKYPPPKDFIRLVIGLAFPTPKALYWYYQFVRANGVEICFFCRPT